MSATRKKHRWTAGGLQRTFKYQNNARICYRNTKNARKMLERCYRNTKNLRKMLKYAIYRNTKNARKMLEYARIATSSVISKLCSQRYVTLTQEELNLCAAQDDAAWVRQI